MKDSDAPLPCRVSRWTVLGVAATVRSPANLGRDIGTDRNEMVRSNPCVGGVAFHTPTLSGRPDVRTLSQPLPDGPALPKSQDKFEFLNPSGGC